MRFEFLTDTVTVFGLVVWLTVGSLVYANPEADAIAAKLTGQRPLEMKARSLTRGTSEDVQPEIKTETQSIITTQSAVEEIFKARGAAVAFEFTDQSAVEEILESEGKIEINKISLGDSAEAGVGDFHVKAGQDVVEIKIKVDPESKLDGEINFVKGKAVIADKKSEIFLNNVAEALREAPTLVGEKFVIQGHASAEGSAIDNLELSQARANAIFIALERRGVRPEMIFPVGVGEQHAVYPESAPEQSLALDRRVIFFRLED